jgi:hypothetical protein
VRGIVLEPLHPVVPEAALRDPQLGEALALFDAIRIGNARERNERWQSKSSASASARPFRHESREHSGCWSLQPSISRICSTRSSLQGLLATKLEAFRSRGKGRLLRKS